MSAWPRRTCESVRTTFLFPNASRVGARAMDTLSSTALTLAEWGTRLDPGGKPADVIELLGQTNEMLTDMLWMEANDGTSRLTTVRTGLPSSTWRLLNYGVAKSKSTTAQVRDATGMLEAYSDIDKA